MSTKQKIILHRFRDGYSERRIARELRINRDRETVRRYLAEHIRKLDQRYPFCHKPAEI